MPRRQVGEGRCSGRVAKPRCGSRVIGAAVGAVVALGATPLAAAPAAHADFDDLISQPIIEVIDQAVSALDPGLWSAVEPGFDLDSLLTPALAAADAADPAGAASFADPFASFDALLADWFRTYIEAPLQQAAASWSASPEAGAAGWLFGAGSAGSDGSPAAAAGVIAPPEPAVPLAPAEALGPQPAADPGVPDPSATASVPLRMEANTEPVVDISIGGGAQTPVLVDTGSAGLVIPWWDLGWQNIGFPTDIGFGAYSGGLGYMYLTVPTTVDFGNDLVTGQTDVNVVVLAYPTTLDALFGGYGNWQSFFAPAGVEGVLGIGPNAVGPTPDAIPTMAFPGGADNPLNQGVLIDQANGVMQFGPNTLTDGTVTVDGSPITKLWVSINDGTLQKVSSIIDSGGVYGTMPSSVTGITSVNGSVATGTNIAVYADSSGRDLLYSYTTTATNAPTVVDSGSLMNTGNFPFDQHPVYIDYSPSGVGKTIFGMDN